MNFQALLQLIFLTVLSAAAAYGQSSAPFHLKDGDRVVFYGDSITDQRLYTTFAETFVITRFPKLDVTFVHSGWGGDRVTGGGGGNVDHRLARDVFAYKPTVMTIMLGMNDASYRAFDEKIFDTYARGYEHIIQSVKKNLPGIRITVIQPSPFDDVTREPRFEGGYNQVLLRYAEFVKELAGREKLNLANLNSPVVAALEKAKAANADLAAKMIPDRVHPGPSGHLLMAAELLKSWNAPATVTRVEIDAREKRVAKAEGTRMFDPSFETALRWTQLDESLPMPVDFNDPVVALAVESSDFMETLNQQTLKVTGLSAPRYVLKIGETKVGAYTREQLAAGINLAAEPTPMAQQARKVHDLTLQHNNLHFTRWRQIQVPVEGRTAPKTRQAVASLLEALDEEEAGLVKEQRAAARIDAQTYELAPE